MTSPAHPAGRGPASRHPAGRGPGARRPAGRGPGSRHPAGRHPARPRRPGARGAESLEFAVCLILLLGVVVTGVRAVQALRLQARADQDARVLARDAALCQRSGPALTTLEQVDGGAPAGSRISVEKAAPSPLVTVIVEFPPVDLVGVSSASAVSWRPRGSATMRREPGC